LAKTREGGVGKKDKREPLRLAFRASEGVAVDRE